MSISEMRPVVRLGPRLRKATPLNASAVRRSPAPSCAPSAAAHAAAARPRKNVPFISEFAFMSGILSSASAPAQPKRLRPHADRGQDQRMQYRPLGRTGMSVSTIGFGAWAIGGSWGAVDDEVAMRALHVSIDAGVNFIDTADV